MDKKQVAIWLTEEQKKHMLAVTEYYKFGSLQKTIEEMLAFFYDDMLASKNANASMLAEVASIERKRMLA